ncbi:MAG: GNAT family N-acetyltransferase [Ktedonobacteraceae bacterium]
MIPIFDFDAFPVLETHRLLLREMTREDAEAVYRIFSDAEVMRYYDTPAFTSLEEAQTMITRQRQRFEQKERFRWGISLKSDNSIIGTGGYVAWNKHWYVGELGYDLARTYWRQGIMSEAISAMIDFGFTSMGLNRIEADVMPENTASARLLHKLGFQEEGTRREYAFWGGTFHDLTLFSLLKREHMNRV